MKHIFIVNPAAGGGAAETKYLPRILSAVKANNADYEIHRSLSAADTTNWIKHRSQNGDHVRFYAVGGDGTINDTISGLIDCPNTELAVIPCGSGNDFVRNWTKSEDNYSIDALMNAKESFPVDVISYNGEYSINMVNIGADCDVVVQATALKDKFPGSASYIAGALRVLPKSPKYHMTYSIDDGEEIESDFLLMCIANGRYCGGGFMSCPKASLSDGKMDLCLVNPIGGLGLVPLMMVYRQGKHVDDPKYEKYVKYVQCEKFRLTARDAVNVSKDGEVSKFVSAEFKVLRGAINLVIPEDSKLIDK